MVEERATNEPAPFGTWAIVEIMGRQTWPGLVTEESLFGTVLCRVDVPEILDAQGGVLQPPVTKYFGGTSIYCLTPVSESVARAAAARLKPEPISVYMPELRYPGSTRALIAPNRSGDDEDDDEF